MLVNSLYCKPYLSVIIVVYNNSETIKRCIDSIYTQLNERYKSLVQIIVIDNCSTDASIEKIRKYYKKRIIDKQIILIKNINNYGFSKAINQGIKLSHSHKILLLNPDTKIIGNSLSKLIEILKEESDVAIIGGMLLKPNRKDVHGTYVNKVDMFVGIFDFTNIRKVFPNNVYHRNFYYKNIKVKDKLIVYGLSGGFLAFDKSICTLIGLLDENYFMYLEDIDFCYRAKKKNIDVVYNSTIKAIHYSGSSSNNKYRTNIKAWRKSRNLLLFKHERLIRFIIYKVFQILDSIISDLKSSFFTQ